MNAIDVALQQLKISGLRSTQPRRWVLEELQKSERAIDAQEIHRRISAQRSMDLVTVYRILETFLEHEIIHKIQSGYLLCTHNQCESSWHMVTHCERCGKHEEHHIPERKLKSLEKFLDEELQFSPRKHPFIIAGRCSSC